ncbi:hypothetical protein pipiens_010572 [Culex pipiens pipiens]|uniref:Uncharacterized protein n=1 Tax=Culex pipiens pipiens TaxID=38569 RepID=A0ABD1D9N1_CULPP
MGRYRRTFNSPGTANSSTAGIPKKMREKRTDNDASALAPRTVCLTLDSGAFDWLEIVPELSVALECESAAGIAEDIWNGPRLPTLPLENCFDESIPVRSWVDPAKPGAASLSSITFSTDKNCNSAPSNHTLTSYSAS